jgi:hypothetical protein
MTGRRIAVVSGGVSGITAGCGLQYAGQRGMAGLAAGLPRGRGRYLRMLAEVPRFHRAARRVLDHGDPGGQVLADFLRTGGFSRYGRVPPAVRRLRRPDQRLHTAPAETGAATECRSRNSAGKGLRKVCSASQPNSPPLA